jgi:RNA polymerase sigma factor (sigma-70 family)
MAGGRPWAASRQLYSLFAEGTLGGLSDGQLVGRYLARGDELAFEALVERHGPMVVAVCRRSLLDPADLDDAFQATFLVLARRSGAVRNRGELGGWLFGVSRRVCLLANRARVRRLRHERRAAEQRTAKAFAAAPPLDDELSSAIDEEIERLPRVYRLPVVLCLLEGRTRSEAAAQLRWTEGMVRGRLARARALLRSRLTRRGLAPAVVLASLARARPAECAIPRRWIENAARLAAGRQAAAGLSALDPAALAQGVIRTMTLKKLAAATLGLLLVAGLTVYATSLVAGEDTPLAAAPPAGTAAGTRQDPAAAAGPERPKDRDEKKRPTHVFEEASDFNLWKQKAQLELKSLQAQLDAKKAEIAQRESEYKVKQLARDLALYDALVKPIPMSFAKETPLEDVLKYIKKESSSPALPSGLPIYVDPNGLKEAGKTLSSSVVIELEGVPLGTTLRLILRQLGLYYQVKDGMLTITDERVHGMQ